MRHPNTGLSEDDLSRLTGSSSSSASCRNNICNTLSSSSSSSSSSSATSSPTAASSGTNIPDDSKKQQQQHQQQHIKPKQDPKSPSKQQKLQTQLQQQQQQHQQASSFPEQLENNKNAQTRFSSTYLPEIINPLEWQKSRKRKERLDSSSSSTQDRKLQRSNSEELLPQDNDGKLQNNNNVASTPADLGVNALKSLKNADNIRRVSSEDFKRTPYEVYEQELKEGENVAGSKGGSDENDGSLANRQAQRCQAWTVGVPIKDMSRRSRYETSPARSQRHSPIRVCFSGNGNSNNGKHRDSSDDSECEHERRRSSERFCKTRAPPGRKASGITKKSTNSSNAIRYLPTKLNDENVYKYDLSTLKHERRGFISKKSSSASSMAANACEKNNTSDLNDNNLIDFNNATSKPLAKSTSPTASSNGSTDDVNINNTQQQQQQQKSSANSSQTSSQTSLHKLPLTTSAQDALPWDRSVPEDQTPVLSRRYATVRPQLADSIDTAAKLSKVKPFAQPYHKQHQTAAQMLANDFDDDDCMESTFRVFTSLENMKTRELMQQVLPNAMAFQTPEERMKQINKRVTALKKKLTQLEDSYEMRCGYKPSQADRLNDKYMKHILSELSKLRKERHELKADPMAALGLKVSGGMSAEQKLIKMKGSLLEIEQSLGDKREDSNRSDDLDDLSADQLVQEKTAVQHGLLYFESLYGRPSTKDERDAARPLYDRYRQLKRMVSRSVTQTGSCLGGAPELPTILEHEAMVFESTPLQYSSNNSTENTNSPTTESQQQTTTNTTTASSDESTTTTTTTTNNTATAVNNSQTKQQENISFLTIEQLWDNLDKVREEKKLLKRIIREYETVFEEQNGRKMLKCDRKIIEETYAQYKEKKAKTRLLQALIKKQISR